ncbi:MAG TPA: CAP domain-containing protein [Actinocrinis sp.]
MIEPEFEAEARPDRPHRHRHRRRKPRVVAAIFVLPTLFLVTGFIAVTEMKGSAASGNGGLGHPGGIPGSSASASGNPGARISGSPDASPSSSPSPSASASPSAADSASAPAMTQAAEQPEQAPPSSAQSAPGGGTTSVDQQVEQQVFDLINQERAQNGLPAYTLSADLTDSATAHNNEMAAGCGLSHQCPGEPPIGTRETDAGVTWTSAGENIGEGGPVSATESSEAQMALGLTTSMYNEQPPDDGHRLNILSSSYTEVGIAVTVDSSGTLWLTQDFAGD